MNELLMRNLEEATVAKERMIAQRGVSSEKSLKGAHFLREHVVNFKIGLELLEADSPTEAAGIGSDEIAEASIQMEI